MSTTFLGAPRESLHVGILSGLGKLPELVARGCLQQGITPTILRLPGRGKAGFERCRVLDQELKSMVQIAMVLRTHKISHVVLAGKYRRSTARGEARKESNSIRALVTRAFIGRSGDNRALKRLALFFRMFGAKVVAPQVFCPNLCPSKRGAMTKAKPSVRDSRDIVWGTRILKQLSHYDIGQAVVVCDGVTLGVEALEGTDDLLRRARRLKLKTQAEGGVMVKLPKFNQDRRFDLPALGVQTIRLAAKAGLNGIAVEAQGALLIPREETLRAAEDLGVFLFVLPSVADSAVESL